MLFGWLARTQPSIPQPRLSSSPSSSRSSSRSTPSRLVFLPTSGPGWHDAVVHLEDVLSAWSLPVTLARRWLQPARELFEHQRPRELFVQLEPIGGLVSVELWDGDGAKVFGAEAFLGDPERLDYTLEGDAQAS